MPVETIKCRECGSAEVTEFKPGSYVCGHCEAIFKHVKSASGGAAGCEIDSCGVTAIGRCSTCGLAFCGTHQARLRDYLHTAATNWCTRCQAEREENERHKAEAARQSELDAYWNAVRRVRRAALAAAKTMSRTGRPTLPLAECVGKSKEAALRQLFTGEPRVHWWVVTREVGRGWKVPFDSGVAALADDGRLFYAGADSLYSSGGISAYEEPVIQVGRRRTLTVLAVRWEYDLTVKVKKEGYLSLYPGGYPQELYTSLGDSLVQLADLNDEALKAREIRSVSDDDNPDAQVPGVRIDRGDGLQPGEDASRLERGDLSAP